MAQLAKYQKIKDIYDSAINSGSSEEQALIIALEYTPYKIQPNIDSPQDSKLFETQKENDQFLMNKIVAIFSKSSYLLSKIKLVDGEGSQLDADTLDGKDLSHFATASSNSNKANKNLDNVSEDVFRDKIKTVDGEGSGINADKLDGHEGSEYVLNNSSQALSSSSDVLTISGNTLTLTKANGDTESVSLPAPNLSGYVTSESVQVLASDGDPISIEGRTITIHRGNYTNHSVNIPYSSSTFVTNIGWTIKHKTITFTPVENDPNGLARSQDLGPNYTGDPWIDEHIGSSDRDFEDMVVTADDVAPVPEPATILLFGAGLIGIAGFARKKVQK
jgi:hypothetical protein